MRASHCQADGLVVQLFVVQVARQRVLLQAADQHVERTFLHQGEQVVQRVLRQSQQYPGIAFPETLDAGRQQHRRDIGCDTHGQRAGGAAGQLRHADDRAHAFGARRAPQRHSAVATRHHLCRAAAWRGLRYRAGRQGASAEHDGQGARLAALWRRRRARRGLGRRAGRLRPGVGAVVAHRYTP
ncbi:hypothetical protein D9M69_559330 [compost metagenome]